MKYTLSIIVWLMMSFSVLAIGVDEVRLENPQEEARAQGLMKELRCLVCQNQSIVDSDASLAKDLRIIVRERILAGDSDEQVLSYMTNRYGDWVLLKPPFDGATIILWLSPVLLLIIGFFIVLRNQQKRKSYRTVEPLTDDEKKRLSDLLDDERSA